MAKVEVRLRPLAERDLEDIWRFTARRWTEKQAERYVAMLLDEMEALAVDPSRGRSAEAVRAGYWRREVASHVIFYRPTETGGVEVVRILHARMDPDVATIE